MLRAAYVTSAYFDGLHSLALLHIPLPTMSVYGKVAQ